MKKNFFAVLLISILLLTLYSCQKGEAVCRLNGDETELPSELKGLKVYTVQLGGLSEIKVAVLNQKVVGTTYSEGKHSESVVIVDNREDNQDTAKRVIYAKEVLYESDDIITLKK